jgi:hypothetical protein
MLTHSIFSPISDKVYILTAAAMNVVRAVNWLEGVPLAKARQSQFAKLTPVEAIG